MALPPATFELVVLAAPTYTATLTRIFRHQGLTFSVELDGEAGGTLTLDAEDALFRTLLPGGAAGPTVLDQEHYLQVWEGSSLRGGFFLTKVTEVRADPGTQRRMVTIAGEGPAYVLKWARVLPPGFPSQSAPYWTFTNQPVAAHFLSIANEAKARGAIPSVVTWDFSGAQDSAGTPWNDSSSVQQENGSTVYELLVHHMDIAGANWTMTPDFHLQARLDFGAHKETQVIFTEGSSNTLSKRRSRDRAALSNFVAVEDSFGVFSTATDNASVTKWGRRELYVSAGTVSNAVTRDRWAGAALKQFKDEITSWTLEVEPARLYRRVFVDYALGDWVAAERSYVDRASERDVQRVVVIAVSVDPDGQVTLELTFQSKEELEAKRLQRQIDKLGGDDVNASDPGIVDIPPLEGIPDVEFPTDPLPGDVLTFDPDTGTWTNVPFEDLDGTYGGGGGGGSGGGAAGFVFSVPGALVNQNLGMLRYNNGATFSVTAAKIQASVNLSGAATVTLRNSGANWRITLVWTSSSFTPTITLYTTLTGSTTTSSVSWTSGTAVEARVTGVSGSIGWLCGEISR